MEYDKATKRICESLGFSDEYVAGLLDILISIAKNERTIVDFANRLTYLEEQMRSSYKHKYTNAVTLTTIHSAKGLEWEQVYLIDLVEGIIPEWETIKAEQSREEGIIRRGKTPFLCRDDQGQTTVNLMLCKLLS